MAVGLGRHTLPVGSPVVAEAVSAYLADVGISSSHPLVQRIASRVSLVGLDVTPGTNLRDLAAFRARVIAAGGEELFAVVDRSHHAQLHQDAQSVTPPRAFLYDPHLGRYGYGHAWSESATATESDEGGATPTSASYAALDSNWDPSRPGHLTERNWGRSPFRGIPGLDIPTTRSLLAAGYESSEIVRAGRDVERLSRHFGSHAHLFTTPENIERATRLNRVAPGFMAQVDRHVGVLAGIREAEAGIARDRGRLADMEARGEGNSEGAITLRTDIARREEEAARQRQEAQAEMNAAVRGLA